VFVNPDILNQVGPLLIKAAAGLVITGLLGAFMWPVRKIRKEWTVLKADQASIHAELVQQRTNCLSTLQTQGDRQIELLGEVSKTLTGMALSQAEMTGYCKANIGCMPRRRRAAKK
jgi:hypothetical protein